jgi:hypothetical protein
MGRQTLTAGFCLLLLTSTAFCAERPDRVFLMIGQSNMAGRAALEATDELPIEGVMLLDDKGQWIPATNPLNRFASDRKVIGMQRIGPADGFARQLHQYLPRQSIGLVHNARGGSSINEWVPGKPLYDHTLERIRAAGIRRFHGVIWHQGESDAQDPVYIEKLVALVENLRRDLHRRQLPFIAGEVFKDLPVNAQMHQLPDRLDHTAVVSARDLKVFDGVHFDRQSQGVLGRRYAEALLKMLK